MTTFTIEVPEKARKTLADVVEQLGGKVIAVKEDKKQGKAAKKQQILDDLEASVKFVNLHQQGKVEAKPLDQLMDEL